MRFKVVACGVFEPYLDHLASESPHEIVVKPLDAGLHARPHDLRLLAQEEIDEADRAGGFDAVLLFYGLCGRGTAGLIARAAPVVIPRAHDCITLFLGSAEAYRKQFALHPGTFYSTLGWIEKATHPRNREAAHLYHNYLQEGYESHPAYGQMRERYGDENTRHVLSFLDRWKRNYSRSAYIHLGMPGETEYADVARRMAHVNEWSYETIEGDVGLMRRMMLGDWDDDRLFVLPPHSRSASTGDDRLFEAVPIDQTGEEPVFAAGEVVLARESGEHAPASGVGLGIDAGGTYTDAVVYDLGARRLLAKAKSLTTYHDLVIGIRGALEQLPSDLLRQVSVTALSTTLATNAMVEGRGHKVGLIVLSPWDWFAHDIDHRPFVRVPGSVSSDGEVLEDLDEEACRLAIARLLDEERCAAIVVAGYGLIRNPSQANRVRELVRERADVPVICSHELSRRLNGVRSARTAVVNARLLPVIRRLIDAVRRSMDDFHIPGRLMVVKGDGTPVDETVARERPIETLLSGPAASVSGARILTNLEDALVVDIGGTTTDCAVLENGRVSLAEDGARVGEWLMSVDVADICTVGLGGDSRFDFTRDRVLTLGPRRNIPFACLASQYTNVARFLHEFDERRFEGVVDAAALDVLARGGPGTLALTEKEARLLDLLEHGPMSALEVASRLDIPTYKLLPLARLEEAGMLLRAALTPTDLLHITGTFTRWDAAASERALAIFAAMLGRPPKATLEEAMRLVTRRLFDEVLRREVSMEDSRLHALPKDWEYLLDRAFEDDGRGLGIRMSLRRPIVAIGAPANALMPALRKHMDAHVVYPEHADVANAIGAIGAEVVIREEVLIQPGQASNYVLYGASERMEFSELERATETAVNIASGRARRRAIEAGAHLPSITVSRGDRAGTLADGARLFLERRVTAVASGTAFR